MTGSAGSFPARRRPGRVLASLAGMAAVSAAALWAAPASAQFVLYFRTFGDWSVVCALDEPTGQKRCTLGAPTPAGGRPAATPRLAVRVVAPARGETAVGLEIEEPVDAGRPVALRVDSGDAHAAPVRRTGEAAWRGTEAARLIDEMAAGHTLVIRFFAPGAPAPVQWSLSVGDFSEALAAYRDALARLSAQPSGLTSPAHPGF